MLFDSHCHLDFPAFDSDRAQMLESCAQAGIHAACVPGTIASDWPRLLQLIRQPNLPVSLYGALGLHPCFMPQHRNPDIDHLGQLLETRPDNVVAIGEIGLDFYIPEARDDAHKKLQLDLLSQQLELARHYQLPVILHVRKAYDQVHSLIRKHRFDHGGIVHAFSGSAQQAHKFIDRGFCLGIGGTVTYDRATRLHKLITDLPASSLVLETDSPDMPPAGQKGQRNTPLTLLSVVRIMSELRGKTPDDIARQCFLNTCKALKIQGLADS